MSEAELPQPVLRGLWRRIVGFESEQLGRLGGTHGLLSLAARPGGGWGSEEGGGRKSCPACVGVGRGAACVVVAGGAGEGGACTSDGHVPSSNPDLPFTLPESLTPTLCPLSPLSIRGDMRGKSKFLRFVSF